MILTRHRRFCGFVSRGGSRFETRCPCRTFPQRPQMSCHFEMCIRDSDYPYGVPMSYAYDDGKLYFHGMPAGHKMDALKKHDKVSFTVIETDHIVPDEYTTYYRSVIVFGRAKIIEDPEEKVDALLKLVDKYSADYREGTMEEINGKLKAVCTVSYTHPDVYKRQPIYGEYRGGASGHDNGGASSQP